jgi:hypothetical protein
LGALGQAVHQAVSKKGTQIPNAGHPICRFTKNVDFVKLVKLKIKHVSLCYCFERAKDQNKIHCYDCDPNRII